jgi:2'-5' RNA ligase
MPSPTSRSFIAIPISKKIQTQISHLQKQLAKQFKNQPISWERPEKLHLTLTFLGNITTHLQHQVLHTLSNTPHQTSTQLHISSLSYFKKTRTDTIIFLEITDPKNLLRKLHQNLTNQLLKFSLSPTLKFHPHITIARIKPRYRSQIGNLSQLKNFPLPNFPSFPLKLQLWSTRFDNNLNTTTYSRILD